MYTIHAVLLQGLAEYSRLDVGGALSRLQYQLLNLDTETFIKVGAGLVIVLALTVNRIRPH